jgi:Ca2+-binding RTX toxin-like protein
VQAILNGQSQSFNKTDVKRIWVESFGGNDRITNNTTLRSTLIGDSGNDTITGGSGQDELDAGTGADHLSGGGGDNLLTIDGTDDVMDYSGEAPGKFIPEEDQGTVFPIGITDFRVSYRNQTASDVIAGHPTIAVLLTPGDDTVTSSSLITQSDVSFDLGKGDDDFLAPEGMIRLVNGNDGNDTISYGPSGLIVSILGGSGNDTINDTYGGTGTKLIDGGSGTDTYNLHPDAVQITLPVYHRDVPGGIENFNFSAPEDETNLLCNGNGLNNNINVFAHNATIHGGSGDDQISFTSNAPTDAIAQLFGDSGKDTFIPDNAPEIFSGGSNSDTIDYSSRSQGVKVTLDNVANDGSSFLDILDTDPPGTGPHDNVKSDIETVIGGGGADRIIGNPFANLLKGNGGNDTIYGGDGNDTLDGGAGHDHLYGQGGEDLLPGKDGRTDTLDGGGGLDEARRDNSATIKDLVLGVEVVG